jgi:hypothetical protein
VSIVRSWPAHIPPVSVDEYTLLVDPETEAPHIYQHGMDEGEVIDVLSSAP